jgi:hypothetical protein
MKRLASRREIAASPTLDVLPSDRIARGGRTATGPPRSPRGELEPIRPSIPDTLAFSGFVAASVAALLTAAHARLLAPLLGDLERAGLIGLAFAGTSIVYGVDRLRDVERDRMHWPDRATFALHHARWLQVVVGFATAMALACAATQRPWVWGVCLAIGGLGLAHRRLKARIALKLAYLTLAWWMVTVGLPWLYGGPSTPLAVALPVASATACALAANMLVSNEAGDLASPARARRWALVLAMAGFLCAVAAPGDAAWMAWIPALQGVAILPSRSTERYLLWAVDGSLALGAALALVSLA